MFIYCFFVPCQTQLELASELGVTQQVISYRLQKLGKIRKKSRVPHKLTPKLKQILRYCSLLNLQKISFKKKNFLHQKIVSCDEKWILYDNPERRKSWVRPGEYNCSSRWDRHNHRYKIRISCAA